MKALAVDPTRLTHPPDCFAEIAVEPPTLRARDLLVRVRAVSINPVDYKVRSSIQDKQSAPQILGWDAAGVVEQVGSQVSLFKPGDEVYYAGNITRPGSNSELHAVDERIVGRKPARLSFEQAAALPLTTITAWEGLFERMGISDQKSEINHGKHLLIIGGAGGVGSIAIQLAKQVAGLTVIATASRPETVDWCLRMGADYTINHHQSFKSELEGTGIQDVDYIFCLNDTEQHLVNMAETIKPQGKICSIVETEHSIDMNLLKNKSVTFAWEFMFTRSIYETNDMQAQHDLLNKVSTLVDQQIIESTMTECLGSLTPENLAKAHAQLESGRTIGKLVLSGFAQ
ncbi:MULTISPECIES: zinc-binding alcohol dehydrogenase family protein [unclassified Leptolyngbya]|uniref:zinc-binding alcohol dehydrogenase family protein n=1 Tax=unclassified Leptolyngbya TaxID=2650499 RepID=UPI00168951E6|nr:MULTISPECIES: zinc-binding alcohol dehydrogenase family protein [unclassified Leptolyngbya]MBD1914070.1 zinc-binding alcohol dehydrogenase family protein [Leptolyngbya sp. FACHB-8]MBD2152990.1 zinc-binding alcohol dehydrogenase family protein [Leptolyngbya sp. FACHB-16]